MTDLAKVVVRFRNNCCVASIVGEIDMSNAEEVTQALEAQLEHEYTRYIVDLSDTAYLDSAGVRLLFTIAERLGARGHDLFVVAPERAPVRRLLLLVDIESRASLHTDLESALDIGA